MYDRCFHDVGEKIEENETTLSFAHLAQIHFFLVFGPRTIEKLKILISKNVFLKVQQISCRLSYLDPKSVHWCKICAG